MNRSLRVPVLVLLAIALSSAAPARAQEGGGFFGDLGLEDVQNVLEGYGALPAAGSVIGYFQSGCEVCPPELEIVNFPCESFCYSSSPVWISSETETQLTLDDTYARYVALRAAIQSAATGATVFLTSAYRPQTYQNHLYSIYKARQYRGEVGSGCKISCATELDTLDDECSCHGICRNPVARISSHGSGQAFDIRMGTMGGLSDCEVFEIARSVGLSLLIECRAYHFVASDNPTCAKKCGGPYTPFTCGIPGQSLIVEKSEQILGDEGEEFIPPEWRLNLGGIDFTSIIPSIFSFSGILAPDQFGPGGPGTAPDGIGDNLVQLVGSTFVEDATQWVFSDPMRIVNGRLSLLENLTYTDTPPPVPESLVMDPQKVALEEGESADLFVTAHLIGGATADVSERRNWTLYESSDPEVARVDLNGRVTALGLGYTRIKATNGNAEAVAFVRVR